MTFSHAVVDSCAADGMCASKCPVGDRVYLRCMLLFYIDI